MTSIRNRRGHIERPGVWSACLACAVIELRRSVNADSAEPRSTCSLAATDSEHGPCVVGEPTGHSENVDHDCRWVPAEPFVEVSRVQSPLEPAIMRMADSGLPMSVIAMNIGCSRGTVSRIVRRAYGRWCDDERLCADDGDLSNAQEVADDIA